jgi:hypothetical protein
LFVSQLSEVSRISAEEAIPEAVTSEWKKMEQATSVEVATQISV